MNTNSQTTRLYHSPLSPFCRKVRLVLAEKKIEVELVEERYWESPPDLKRRNPAGKLPVLRHRGNMLAESQAIIEYLDEAVPAPSLMPQTPLERHEVPATAYFSPEYGITSVLPQYSGGLGILAGDHLKTASDLGVPLTGVGLLYRHGYFRQALSREGWQQESYPVLDPDGLPIRLLHWNMFSFSKVEASPITKSPDRPLKRFS